MEQSKPHLLYDCNIAGVEALFAPYAHLVRFSDAAELATHIDTADALLVSSQTRLDDTSILSSVRFIGSPTAGTSHISEAIRNNPNYHFANAKGSNANAVADYVFAAISEMHYPITQSTCIGIIGFGHVGKCVAHRLKRLAGTVLAFDPLIPTWQTTYKHQHVQPVDLHVLLARADVVTVHCNLHDSEPHPSRNMLGHTELTLLQPHATLINTARGEVIEPHALDDYLAGGNNAVLDVWHNEPHINTQHVAAATLSTPHIAGYTHAAKQAALMAVRTQFCRCFALNERAEQTTQSDSEKSYSSSRILYRMVYNEDELLSQAARIVDLKSTSQQCKQSLQLCSPAHAAKEFLSLRTSYSLRTQIHYD